jgi:hypothetical protein
MNRHKSDESGRLASKRGFVVNMAILFRFCFFVGLSLPSVAANAGSCQDQTGNYVSKNGLEIQIRQTGCESILRTVIENGVPGPTVSIILDGKYRKLPDMPQFLTAFTYDGVYRVGNAKLIESGQLVSIFNSRVSENGDWIQQTIKLDGNGNVLSSTVETFFRK